MCHHHHHRSFLKTRRIVKVVFAKINDVPRHQNGRRRTTRKNAVVAARREREFEASRPFYHNQCIQSRFQLEQMSLRIRTLNMLKDDFRMMISKSFLLFLHRQSENIGVVRVLRVLLKRVDSRILVKCIVSKGGGE